jgi:hypothetical protein
MRFQRVKSTIRRYERIAFYWYMGTGQFLKCCQCKEQYIAYLRFRKNLKRHLQPNSIYMKEWEYIQQQQREKP